ncbi:hypothetical protein G6F57_011460 [Rhizopus arrhizus]|nr:hypothetical protein G6F30_011455 [Rhizopus arrhizus]KAG1410746.1 hypothetical protein G6F58_008937 [Rhizopus delemar]KAG0975415.1 hypothetical protein G6F29_011548 [Rhizopus arrhizus]KAG0981674.1 hypothetical protein G6F28_011366 [Rhizopus arrhizus]KAG1002890.1 hypothetical protein G6F27_011549 [Rhizopus arrhizus]
MAAIKAHELRNKNKAELLKVLDEQKQALANLRVQKVAGGKNQEVGEARKNVARVLTVINQTQREQLALFYHKKKYVPLDLRVKKTRAMRRALTPFEKSKKTLRQQKKEAHFPLLMSHAIEYRVNEKQQQDLVDLKTKTMMKPAGRVRHPRIRKKDPNHIPRPVNSFLAYRTEMQAIIRQYCPLANHREISKVVAKWWHEATTEEKQIFKDKAELAKYSHAQKYPHYKFSPKKKKAINNNAKKHPQKPKEGEQEIKEEVEMVFEIPLDKKEKSKEQENTLESYYHSCMYPATVDPIMEQNSTLLHHVYLPQEAYCFNYNSIMEEDRQRRMNMYQDYVLMDDLNTFGCDPIMTTVNTAVTNIGTTSTGTTIGTVLPYYDLTPASQPLLTPEPEYPYISFSSSSISPYMLHPVDYWFEGVENYKRIPFEFTEELSSKNVFLRLPDEFSPMERMILQANGNLQRLLSAYYNVPSHVEIIKNIKSQGINVYYEREIKMYFENKFVYNAQSILTVKDDTVLELIEKHKYGLGQIFGHTHTAPQFTLHAVGRHGDSKGASFWRDYSLTIPDVLDCFIRESFIENLFDEFKGNRNIGFVWFADNKKNFP